MEMAHTGVNKKKQRHDKPRKKDLDDAIRKKFTAVIKPSFVQYLGSFGNPFSNSWSVLGFKKDRADWMAEIAEQAMPGVRVPIDTFVALVSFPFVVMVDAE